MNHKHYAQHQHDQKSPESAKSSSGQPAIPSPLSIPPSRARRQLAARLAQRQKQSQGSGSADPDAEDSVALETASHLPEEPNNADAVIEDSRLGSSGEGRQGLQTTGLRTLSGSSGLAERSRSKFEGLFGSDDSDSSDDAFDEDAAGRDDTLDRPEGDYEDDSYAGGRWRRQARRPSTTEAKERKPLDDDDEEDEELSRAAQAGLRFDGAGAGGAGPFEDSPAAEEEESDDSDDDDMVEIRPRRTS
ncbi:hypothetical protein EJ03DRAFT_59298 [Teratosphaeria nubilosa]|uniref:Uncharacterized protein n=1 Tax=Teratosphaeria nubilosa TaxID=161662 RepID=A0A6G1LDD5_9PEZI|nr:hypothetical protein EJ03DRAFT_59298 [Teratosphaeria nubilosa]